MSIIVAASPDEIGEVEQFIPSGLMPTDFYAQELDDALRVKLKEVEAKDEIKAYLLLRKIEGIWRTKALLTSLDLEMVLTPDEMRKFQEDHLQWRKRLKEAQAQRIHAQQGPSRSDYEEASEEVAITVKYLKERISELEKRISDKWDKSRSLLRDRFGAGKEMAGGDGPAWVKEGYSITDTMPSPDSRFVAYELGSRRDNYVHVSDQKTGAATDIHSPDQEDIQTYLKTSGFEGEAAGRRWLEKVTWLKDNRLEVVFRLSLFRGVNGNDMLVTRLYADQDGKGFRQVGEAKFEIMKAPGH